MLESLYKEYRNKIYRLAISIVHNDKDAEEVIQNTFIKIMEKMKGFRHESNISTWIYKIAYNEALMYLRKKSRQLRVYNNIGKDAKRIPGWVFVNWAKLPDKQLLDKELKERLERCFSDMPIKYRMPLLLHQIEGIPLKKSAEILHIKEGSLKTRIHRALLIVRSVLFEYFKDKEEAKELGQEKSCNSWTGFLYSFTKGELDPKTRSAFEKHISGCSNCKKFIDGYARAIAVTEALECKDIPHELKEKMDIFVKKGGGVW